MDTSKIIRGIVNSRGYTITSAITQWDYGYVFVPEFEDMPATYRLDFSNDEHHGTALPVYCGSEGGEVPEELIDTGKDIFVWFFYIGDGFGKSEYKWRIPNHCKPKTEQDEPSPTQQSSIDQLIVRSNEAVTSAEQSASDASASAQSAQGYAEQAESARDTAQSYANNAQTSANNASASALQANASATASARSANQAAQIKADVEELVDDAQGYAQASANSATASANSASQAQGYAQSASSSANSASGYASQADISANTASNKASEASTSASTASQKATESAQSATNASQSAQTAEQAKTASQTAQGLAEQARDTAVSAKTDAESAKADAESARDEAQQAVASISGALDDKAPVITDTASGAIASFSDGADDLPLKSLVVNIDPVQDLHGQESPYPAGGGVNKWNFAHPVSSTNASVTENADGTFSVVGSSASAKLFYLVSVKPNQIYSIQLAKSNESGNTSVFGYGTIYDGNDDTAAVLINSLNFISGKTFTPTGDYVYIAFLVTGGSGSGSATASGPIINEGSTTATFAPFENLCPISGWTEVDVQRTGRNVFDPTKYVAKSGNRNPVSLEGDTYTMTWVDGALSFTTKGVQTFPAGTYTISATGSNVAGVRLFVYNAETDALILAISAVPAFTASVPFYIGVGGDYRNLGTAVFTLQLETGSTATAYEPYKGTLIPISWQSEAGTVYGGKLDVLSGVLTIDRAMVDLGTLTWYKQSGASVAIFNCTLTGKATGVTNLICSQYLTTSVTAWNSTKPDKSICGSASTQGVTVRDESYSDSASFTAAMDGVQLCYELAEPIEIQLSANQINSLLGVNNIWADSGDTEVVYRADTKLYISKKIAEAISALS